MNPEKPFTRLLADLPEALAHHARVITLKKGDLLLRTGEVCQNAYFINKGLFVNIFMTDKGKDSVTGFSSDDQYPFLSEISYFTQTPSSFEIKALEDSELLCFSPACDAGHHLQTLYDVRHPAILYSRRIYQILVRALQMDHQPGSR